MIRNDRSNDRDLVENWFPYYKMGDFDEKQFASYCYTVFYHKAMYIKQSAVY